MSVFYFCKRWPSRNISSEQERVISFVESIIKTGRRLTLISPQGNELPNNWDLDGHPIETVFANPKKIVSSMGAATNKPAFAIFADFEMEELFSYYMHTRWSKCPRILDISSLSRVAKFRRSVSQPFMEMGFSTAETPIAPSDPLEILTTNQAHSIHRSDYYLCSNDYIFHLLERRLKARSKLMVAGMGLPTSEFLQEVREKHWRPFKYRQNFVYMANLQKDRNMESMSSLIHYIWPRIRKQLPKAELHIYGHGIDSSFWQKRRDSMAKEGIRIQGFMSQTSRLSEYKVSLLPERWSCSTKTKIIESWYEHTPVVTTPNGAESLFLYSSQGLMSSSLSSSSSNSFSNERFLSREEQKEEKIVRDYYKSNHHQPEVFPSLQFGGLFDSFTYDQYANNAVKLHNSEELWEKSVDLGHQIIQKIHSEDQLDVALRTSFARAELAAYEGRGTKEYQEQWKRYVRMLNVRGGNSTQ